MLTISDLKIGTRVLFNDNPCIVVYSEHSKQGRAGAVLRCKLKNLLNGATVEHTFAGAEKLEEADLQTKKAQFLYREGNQFFFMDSESFEQFELNKTQIGESADFLKDGEEVDLLYFNGNPINIQLPIKMTFKITYTEPGFKGNTATNVLKPATIETGAEVKVPIFVKEGDLIVVDTRSGSYVERA
ncbi:MAG: elongation factor P [Candidatus Berkelbacteria bacterium]